MFCCGRSTWSRLHLTSLRLAYTSCPETAVSILRKYRSQATPSDTIFNHASHLRLLSTSNGEEGGAFTKLLSTVRRFNHGLSRLKSDFLISLRIRESTETRLHLDRKQHRELEARRKSVKPRPPVEECAKLADRRQKWLTKHIPFKATRRGERLVIQISKDLQTTLPTVLGFLIPVVGYSFLVLGLLFPKFLLSRQFHTDEQRREFAMDEFGFRRGWYDNVALDFWGSFMRSPPKVMGGTKRLNAMNDILSFDNVDAAGPVWNERSLLYFYDLCDTLLVSDDSPNAFSNLPISHLHSLALAYNLSSILPLPSSLSAELLQYCFPRLFLQRRLEAIAEDIIVDDVTLIEEHLNEGCASLTDDEVTTACLARGLPIGRFARDQSTNRTEDVVNMKRILINHLNMMQSLLMVKESLSLDSLMLTSRDTGISKRSHVRDHALQLLVLHLPAIRHDAAYNSL